MACWRQLPQTINHFFLLVCSASHLPEGDCGSCRHIERVHAVCHWDASHIIRFGNRRLRKAITLRT